MSSEYDKRLDGDPIDRLAMKIDPDCPMGWTVLDLRAAAMALVRLNRENRVLRDRCTALEAGIKGMGERMGENPSNTLPVP